MDGMKFMYDGFSHTAEEQYMQRGVDPSSKKTVLTDADTHEQKQKAIISNLVNARNYKQEHVDPEHNMLIAFDEGTQNQYISDADTQYIESVSNYVTSLKNIKVAEIGNINAKGTVRPLNMDTVTVMDKLNKGISVFFDILGLNKRYNDVLENTILLGNGFTTLFKTNDPSSLDVNFSKKAVLSSGNLMIGSRDIDPRFILIDPSGKSFHASQYIAEEGRVTIDYIKQVIEHYYSDNIAMAKEVYRQVLLNGKTPGDNDLMTGEFLDDAGRYSSSTSVVRLFIYYEKRIKRNGSKTELVIDRYYIANGVIVGYDEAIGDKYPYACMSAYTRRDTPYAQSHISKIISLQKLIDQIDAITTTIGIQTVTPSMVINDDILGSYTDEDLGSAIFTPGNILRGKFGNNTNGEVMKLFASPEIPEQLIKLREQYKEDQKAVLNITALQQGNTGSLQKTGAIDKVVAETKKVDKFFIDKHCIPYLDELHYLLLDLITDVVKTVKDVQFVVPSTTDETGYEALSFEETDVNKLAYCFEFKVDISPLDTQANDELILKELMQIGMQYASENGQPQIVLPEELLKASSLSPDIKHEIIARINEDRALLAEQSRMENQQKNQQMADQQAQQMVQQGQTGPSPEEMAMLEQALAGMQGQGQGALMPQQMPMDQAALEALLMGGLEAQPTEGMPGLTPDVFNNLPQF